MTPVWNVAYDDLDEDIGGGLRVTGKLPYIVSDTGVVIKKLGGLKESNKYLYSDSLNIVQPISFEFWATETYSRGDRHLTRSEAIIGPVLNTVEFVKTTPSSVLPQLITNILIHIRTGLLSYPLTDHTLAAGVVRPSSVIFAISDWKLWSQLCNQIDEKEVF